MLEEEGAVYIFLLYYIKKDNFISTYFIVKSAIAMASISKFGNNDINLTKVLKGFIVLEVFPIMWNQSVIKIKLLCYQIIGLEPEFLSWLDQFYVDKAPPEHTFLLVYIFLTNCQMFYPMMFEITYQFGKLWTTVILVGHSLKLLWNINETVFFRCIKQ